MEIGVMEAKDRLSELLDRAEQGESVTITRHGRPAATLNVVKPQVDMEAIRTVVAQVAEARKHLPPISREEITEAIREGRRY